MKSKSAEAVDNTQQSAPTHPDYDLTLEDWVQMQDCVKGERAIKDAGEKYLPMTSGQKEDGQDGLDRYKAYKQRAVYLNFPKGTINDALGMMFSREPDIETSTTHEYLKDSATLKGEDLASLLQNINRQQLTYGRVFLLADIYDQADKIYMVLYSAKAAINWRTSSVNGRTELDYVLLDESDYVFDESTLEYVWTEQYRVLTIVRTDESSVYYTFTVDPQGLANLDLSDPVTFPDDAVTPQFQGKKLDKIPGTFINVSHTGSDVEEPPLIDQSNIALAYYRGDADYRLSLFKQGQGTFYGTGLSDDEINKDKRVGADGAVYSSNKDAKFGFAELSGQGLQEQANALKDLKTEALALGVTLFDKAGVESGKALETRTAVKTSPIKTMALTGAEGLTKVLKICDEWASVSESNSEVIPNIDFLEINATPQDAMILHTLLREGGMTLEDYHAWLYRNRYTDKSFADWKETREPALEEI
jgi:hypothetical protein